jgi:hypothetical protein
MEKRLPPTAPGPAYLSNDKQTPTDFTLPMELNRDAVVFYALSLRYEARKSESYAMQKAVYRYARAAIVAVFSSLEAQLNTTAIGYAQAHESAIEPIVHDVLTERETTVDENGRIYRRRRLMPFNTRLSFLTAFLSGKELDRGTALWRDLQRAIDLRDACVHSKPPFPWEGFSPADARFVIDTVNAVMLEISRLMGARPQLWWGTADELLPALDAEDLPPA